MSNNGYYYTQFSGDFTKTPNDIVIGFDFGTSSSKIVIRSPFVGDGRSVAVNFMDLGHKGNKFLLPTRPFFDKNGKLQLGDSLSKPQFPALKMRVLDFPDEKVIGLDSSENEYTNTDLSIGYIAEALRISRKWFIETQAKVYGNAQIRWHFNIGIPSTGQKDDRVISRFRDIAKTAWGVSILQTDVTLQNCKIMYAEVKNGIVPGEITDDRIQAIPEVSAQVIGYCKSTSYRDGLHLLIDVGAGTVDICCFILNAGNHYLLGSSVERLGAFELHKLRIEEIKERISSWMEEFGSEEDPILPMPESPNKYLPVSIDSRFSNEFLQDEKFINNISSEINRVLHYVKKKRDPQSPNWKSGVRTFLTGGGSKVKVYIDSLSTSHEWWSTSGGTNGLKLDELTIPGKLVSDGLPLVDYHRLAVAYGLSHLRDELGEIKPESDIKDLIIMQNNNIGEGDSPGHDNSPG